MSPLPLFPVRRKATQRRRPRPVADRLRLEWLEDRTLLAGHTLATATPLALAAGRLTTVSGFLPSGRSVDLYALSLAAGATVRAAVAAQSIGSTLDGVLRVFNAAGQPVASNDNFAGLDPRLAFQAPTAGTYYVGVSSAGDDHYDPTVALGDQGSSLGLYRLQLSVAGTPLLPDVVGASFQVVGGQAEWGDTVTVHYTLENRGGAATPGEFDVGLVLAADNRIATDGELLERFPVAGLAAGASLSGTVNVPLPGAPGAPPAGFTEPEPVFLGLRIDPGGDLRDGVPSPNIDQRQGSDLDALAILLPQTAAAATANFALNSRTAGVLMPGHTADTFTISLPAGESGRLVARVPDSTVLTTLSLFNPTGSILASGEGGLPGEGDPALDVELNTFGGGTYLLEVSVPQGYTGPPVAYALTAQFQPAGLQTDSFVQDNGADPVGLVAADFNGDGLPDLAQADAGSNDVHVLLSAGADTFRDTIQANGTLVAGQSYPVGDRPSALVVGDFNGDGVPDLAVANAGDNDVSILLGAGDGTFHEVTDAAGHPLRPAAGADPGALAVGDFNGDGIPDLAVADAGTDTITILLGKGDGTFQALTPFPVPAAPGQHLTALTTADFDGDGRADLAVALDGSPGHVVVFLGNGDGTFRAGQDATVGNDPVALAAADFNRDGLPDLATADAGSGTVSILRGLGGGQFALAESAAVGGTPGALTTGDLNNDGNVDLAGADAASGDVSVLLGKGDGAFQAPERLAFGRSPVAVVATDLDGDGSVDLVTALPGARAPGVRQVPRGRGGHGPGRRRQRGPGDGQSRVRRRQHSQWYPAVDPAGAR
jgi:hypothetical protein